MIYKTFTIALALFALTACQNNSAVKQDADEPLDGLALTRLAYQFEQDCRAELRNSDEPVLANGAPVAVTGVCRIARGKPLFKIHWPDSAADEFPKLVRQATELYPDDLEVGLYYSAHLDNHPELAQMKQGQKYRVQGRVESHMDFGAYFIDVDSFTAID